MIADTIPEAADILEDDDARPVKGHDTSFCSDRFYGRSSPLSPEIVAERLRAACMAMPAEGSLIVARKVKTGPNQSDAGADGALIPVSVPPLVTRVHSVRIAADEIAKAGADTAGHDVFVSLVGSWRSIPRFSIRLGYANCTAVSELRYMNSSRTIIEVIIRMGGGTVPGPETGYPSGGNAGVATQLGAGKPGPIAAKQGVQQKLILSGWPRSITWDEFNNVGQRPSGVKEDAEIFAETIGGDVRVREVRGRWLIAEANMKVEVNEDESWVVTSTKSPTLLAHEQGHFDIHGIIVGRDMISALGKLRERSQARLGAAIGKVMQKYKKRGQAMTEKYDDDTKHGTDAARQSAWEKEIQRAIKNKSSLRAPN